MSLPSKPSISFWDLRGQGTPMRRILWGENTLQLFQLTPGCLGDSSRPTLFLSTEFRKRSDELKELPTGMAMDGLPDFALPRHDGIIPREADCGGEHDVI